MTTSQNPCPALAGIAKAILSTLSAEDLADVLKSVEPAVMQESLVRSQIVGMDPRHLQLAIDHELITKEQILETIGHTDTPVSIEQTIEDSTLYDIVDALTKEYSVEDIMEEFCDHVDEDRILDHFSSSTLGSAAESKDDDWCDISQVAQSDLLERIDWDDSQVVRTVSDNMSEDTIHAWLKANPAVADELCCKATVLRWIDQNT